MTASIIHVTNLTPGSEQPYPRRRREEQMHRDQHDGDPDAEVDAQRVVAAQVEFEKAKA
jgi:hypothetical protein